MSAKNPNRDIYFFKNTESKLVYVLMSLEIDKDAFYEMFEYAMEITEDECDKYVLEHNYEVVYVGDAVVIDKYFAKEKKA